MRQDEDGEPVPEARDQRGQFYGWKAKYGGMDVSAAQRLKAMEDENRRLKHLVADLVLN